MIRGTDGPRRRARSAVAVLALALATPSLRAQADDWKWKLGRESLVRIVRGDVDGAIEELEARLVGRPDLAEALFVLSVAHTCRGDLEAALAACERGLASGLPIERWLAGPRGLLAPLVSTERFAALAREAGDPVLIHGPLLGCVSDRGARFLARTAREANVSVRLVDQETGATVFGPVRRAWAGRDFTAVVPVDGLEAASEYRYRLIVDGVEVGDSATFRTFPASGDDAVFRVAFGGGAAYTPEFEHAFDAIRGTGPLAFLQLGDNVYIDAPELPAVQEYCYYRRQSSEPYRRLVASVSIAAIWDDHDFGDDDCRGGPEVDSPTWKIPVWDLFRRQWNNPAYGGGRARPGTWFDVRIGGVHFILLDGRYYRTDARQAPRSMLGPEQKRWLFDTLERSDAIFRVIASPVPISTGTKPGSRDTWDGFPEEREEIFSFIEERGIGGVFFIAADRHRSEAWRTRRASGYDMWEFESSRITNIHTHRVMDAALFGTSERAFGELEFDTTRADPTVRFAIRDLRGDIVEDVTLRRSQLVVGHDGPIIDLPASDDWLALASDLDGIDEGTLARRADALARDLRTRLADRPDARLDSADEGAAAVRAVLAPLEKAGVLAPRTGRTLRWILGNSDTPQSDGR